MGRKSRSRSRSEPRKSRREKDRGNDRRGDHSSAETQAAAMWGQYGGQQAAMWGYGAPGYPPGAYGWDPAAFGGAAGGMEKAKKKKKKKKKKKRGGSADSSSSSSSSSSSVSDWRQKIWNNGWQQQNMWPGMWPGWPTQPGAPMPGVPSSAPGSGAPPGWPSQPGQGSVPQANGSGGRQQSSLIEGGDPKSDVPIFLEPAVEETVPVPKALLGKVIGKGAQTIIEIREKSGAFKVDARDQTSDPCLVKVAGTADAVKKAKELIMEMLESTKVKHAGSDYVEIPKAKIGMVIGLKGAQVNEIQMQTNTKIDVDFEADPCRCYIKGENKPDVERAKQVLLTIAMQIEDDRSEYLDLPKAASGVLIGAQGSRVREFQEQSGARIDVDKTGDRCRVRLSGTAEQVANAKALLLHEVEVASQATTSTRAVLNVPPPPQAVMFNPNQPTSFPATLSESIARAKAAAQAVRTGMVPGPPLGQAEIPGGMSW